MGLVQELQSVIGSLRSDQLEGEEDVKLAVIFADPTRLGLELRRSRLVKA